MEIRIESLLCGARKAEGTAIIVDVFRAFTTSAIAFSRGAQKIIMVAEVKEALEQRRRGAGELCIGEVDGMKPPGFDMGNSPFEMSGADVADKSLIQSTRAGTAGVIAAQGASRIYAAALVTAGATARAVCRDAPELVTIVAMGAGAEVRSDEDEQCALYLRNLLQGRTPDKEAVQRLVLAGAEAQKYGDPARPHFHAGDRELAVQIDAFSLAIEVARENGLLVARPRHV